MRIFALETDPGALMKRFVVETEEVLLATSRHWLAFFIPFLLSTLVMAVIAAVLLPLLFGYSILLGMVVALVWFVVFCLLFVNAVIRWKYNFLIVTTEQLIWVTQRSFFFNAITPTTIENIASARVETQFIGFFNVGIVRLSLKERLEATTREMTLTYMPRPGEISSVIENAIVLARQRLNPEEPLQKQQDEFQRIKQEAEPEPNPGNA